MAEINGEHLTDNRLHINQHYKGVNNVNSKFIKTTLFLVSASVVLLAGCGPQNLNDADYLAQTADSELNKDAQGSDDQGDEADDQGSDDKAAPAPAIAKAIAPAGGGGCPTGNCEIPPDADTGRAVQLPDQIRTEVTKIIPTSEDQLATDTVDYHTTRHIYQPSERHHLVKKHRNLVRRHHTKVVYHPTMRRINRVVRTASATDEVMPTEEIVAPVVDYGCVAPVPVPVRRPCGFPRGGCGLRGY